MGKSKLKKNVGKKKKRASQYFEQNKIKSKISFVTQNMHSNTNWWMLSKSLIDYFIFINFWMFIGSMKIK